MIFELRRADGGNQLARNLKVVVVSEYRDRQNDHNKTLISHLLHRETQS